MLNNKAAVEFLNGNNKQQQRVSSNFRRFKQQEEDQQVFKNNFTKVYAGIIAKNKLLHQIKQQERQQLLSAQKQPSGNHTRKPTPQNRPTSGRQQTQQTLSTPYQAYQELKRPIYQTPQHKNPRDRFASAPSSAKPRVPSARRPTMPPTPAEPPLTYNQRFIVLTAAAQAVKQSRQQQKRLCASNLGPCDGPAGALAIKKNDQSILELEHFDDLFEDLNFNDLRVGGNRVLDALNVQKGKQDGAANKTQQKSQEQKLETQNQIKQQQICVNGQNKLENSQNKQQLQEQYAKEKQEQKETQNKQCVQETLTKDSEKQLNIVQKQNQTKYPTTTNIKQQHINDLNDDFDNTETTQENNSGKDQQIIEIDYDKDDYTNYKQFRRNVRSGFADRKELTKVTIDIQEILESNAKKDKLFGSKVIQNKNSIDLQSNAKSDQQKISVSKAKLPRNQNLIKQTEPLQLHKSNLSCSSIESKQSDMLELPLLQSNKEQIRQIAINTIELQNKMVENMRYQEPSSYYYYDFD